MTEHPTPPDWVLIEAAKRGGWHWIEENIQHLRNEYADGEQDDLFRALCDMIERYEQPPVDRKLLCACEAWEQWLNTEDCDAESWIGVRAIELWEKGFGK